ncbi:MAG: NUDIX hydrolase [Pyrinomonadaceae bacterium]
MARPDKNTFRTLEEISAGGVVYRDVGVAREIAIVLTLPDRRWQLPKGLIDEGETAEHAALREVREESGMDADLVEKIETIEYWYFADRAGEKVRYHKLVHFFLMKFRCGNVEDHDDEVAEARWVEINEAVDILEFISEKEVVRNAMQMLSKAINPTG